MSIIKIPIHSILIACLSLMLMAAGCATPSQPWDRVTRLNVTLLRAYGSGIDILVTPRDAQGRLVALDGTLDVKLWVYDNPRGVSFSEGSFRQEWLSIRLDKDSYDPQRGADLSLPYDDFNPDISTLGALTLTLTDTVRSITGDVDRIAIGSESFS